MSQIRTGRSLIIAGMHRSFTSLVAESLQASGLFIGLDLIGKDESNAHGHFESSEIVDFHIRAINSHGLSSWWNLIDTEKAKYYAESDDFRHKAEKILIDHFNKTFFGWKDPRVAFFLEGWHRILPDPHYLIVIRHPVNCINSLIRRSGKNRKLNYRPFLATRYFNLWDKTNRCLLEFIKNYPTKCYVLLTPEALVELNSIERLNEVLIDDWKLPLKPVDFNKYYDHDLVRSSNSPTWLEGLFKTRKSTRDLFKEFGRLSKSQ